MLYLNDQPVNVTIFPDNTSQVWKLPEELLKLKEAFIKWKFDSEGEFMHLSQLVQLLTASGCSWINLELTYLPYGRQDKAISNSTTFALMSFSSALNSLEFAKVIIHDPHSEEALIHINSSKAVYPIEEVSKVVNQNNIDILCYPDKGALTKYSKIYDYQYIHGEKVRDQLTGNITSYKVIGDPASKNVLIVDDICDGGMTFKILAKDLLAAGAKSVVLFVTHGIFSKGTRTLFDSGIQRVFTRDGEMSRRDGSLQF